MIYEIIEMKLWYCFIIYIYPQTIYINVYCKQIWNCQKYRLAVTLYAWCLCIPWMFTCSVNLCTWCVYVCLWPHQFPSRRGLSQNNIVMCHRFIVLILVINVITTKPQERYINGHIPKSMNIMFWQYGNFIYMHVYTYIFTYSDSHTCS